MDEETGHVILQVRVGERRMQFRLGQAEAIRVTMELAKAAKLVREVDRSSRIVLPGENTRIPEARRA